MLTILAICLLALAADQAPSARGGPDFTGDWILVTDGDVPWRAPIELVVRQIDKGTPPSLPLTSVAIERRFRTGSRSETWEIGVEGGVVGGGGSAAPQKPPEMRYSVRWDDGKLVLRVGSYSQESQSYTEHEETWALGRDGMLVTTITDRGSEAGARTTTFTYRRR